MSTRVADDFAAIRARMAELRRPLVVPGSEPDPNAAFNPDRGCLCDTGTCCADPDRCAALGYCNPF